MPVEIPAGDVEAAIYEWREHMHLRTFRYNGDMYITLKNKKVSDRLMVYHLGMSAANIYFVIDVSYEERDKITSPFTDSEIISDMIMGGWINESREIVRERWESIVV